MLFKSLPVMCLENACQFCDVMLCYVIVVTPCNQQTPIQGISNSIILDVHSGRLWDPPSLISSG